MKIEMLEDFILYLKMRTDSLAVECLSKMHELADGFHSKEFSYSVDIRIPRELIIDYLNFKDGL
ncbi:hypothetical protein [Chryseobacterium sp. WX]|uniref:hypothetical protein n=1 Tax=Chryseobacterium sp. WX TaxID=3031803 RepID=UPI00240998B5|nr:hypothetical protein [Chryseobacterium sp. WX]WFB68214.1 hypothetical protein PZ898_02145 [Chryseobacterium sp. WX]